MTKQNNLHIYIIQILFACCITLGSQKIDLDNKYIWINIFRYIFYLLTIRGTGQACMLAYKILHRGSLDVWKKFEEFKNYGYMYIISAAILIYFKQEIFQEDFLFIFIAYLISKYPEVGKLQTINYGVGMACSFFEGYLNLIIPSDGADFVGFERNITRFEDKQGVIFPVKRLFLIITKNLYCPPDLQEFNKPNPTDISYMEVCQVSYDKSLEDVTKSVAAVKNRVYRNSTYKIYRPHKPPVYLAAECVTPIHTLYKVLKNRTLYDELAGINVEELVEDFCTTLRSIISKNPDVKNKIELVFYDNTDPKQNLADVLLEKIRELEPNFEDLRRE